MALQKDILTDFGINAQYWRVVEAHEIFGQAIHIKLFGYVSKELREIGNTCISAMVITIEGDQYIPGMTRADLYAYLKTLPELQGSIDV